MAYDPEYHKLYRELNRDRIRERKRQDYLANKEKIKARSRQWSIDNRERKLLVGRQYSAEHAEEKRQYSRDRYMRKRQECISAMSAWRKANPDKYLAQRLRKDYGITLQEYYAMIAAQNSRCAICGTEIDNLVVDHCHESGRVRGMLCSGCNCGIGNFKDNPTSLRKAAIYLESHYGN